MKKGEISVRTKKLRARVKVMINLLGESFKKDDLMGDFDLKDLYPTPTVLNNMLTRELTRLMELGEIKRSKQGIYERLVKK